jgi:DNA (cytosine-5)-methyltransferase 1
MNHGSLFSGIGGAELAAEWVGWENVFHCEINPFGRRVLDYYWPNAKSYEDITKTDFSIWRGKIDILTGGFPCQPFSVAGKRKGTEDDRNLWPEMLRVIREVRPTWIVGENVYGLISWSGGLVFEQIQADLEAEAYEVWPIILPACSVETHRIEGIRVWIVAYHKSEGWCEGDGSKIDICGRRVEEPGQKRSSLRNDSGTSNKARGGTTTNSEYKGLEGNERYSEDEIKDKERGMCAPRAISQFCGSTNFEQFPTQPPVCSRDDGLSTRLDGITFPKWRNESIKGFGNAWVPQVAYEIFKVINEMSG